MEIPQQDPPSSFLPTSEAEFLDVIGTQFLLVFLLAIHSHLGFYSPSPLSQIGLQLVCNVNIVFLRKPQV
jgi:hypothetical protein